MVLQLLDRLIQAEGDEAKDDQGGDQIVQLEYLAGVYDEISQPFPGGQEFADDDADQTKADVDLQDADDGGYAGWKYYAAKHLHAGAAERVDHFDRFFICSAKRCIHADDTAKYCHGHTGDDDRLHVGAQPYDQERGQS